MSLDIKIENLSTHCKMTLIGDCTIYSVAKLKQSLLEVLLKNENVLVDLANVNDFDTAAIQLFLSAKNTARANKRKIKFTSHSEAVLALLDLYGLVGFFGDKVVLTPLEKKNFPFSYGTKKLPSFLH